MIRPPYTHYTVVHDVFFLRSRYFSTKSYTSQTVECSVLHPTYLYCAVLSCAALCCTEVGSTVYPIHGSPDRPCTGAEQTLTLFFNSSQLFSSAAWAGFSATLSYEGFSSLDGGNLFRVSGGDVTRAWCSATTLEARFHGGMVVFTLGRTDFAITRCRLYCYRRDLLEKLPVYMSTYLDRRRVHSFHLGDDVWSPATFTACA